MTREQIQELFARRQEAFSRLDAAALAADYAADCTVDSPLAGGTASGLEAIENLYRTYFAAFPDFKFDSEQVLIDGDETAQIGRISGTDNGGFMGMAPTHRRVSIPITWFYTLRGGKIVRERRVYDFTGVLIQVGLLKAKPV